MLFDLPALSELPPFSAFGIAVSDAGVDEEDEDGEEEGVEMAWKRGLEDANECNEA